MANFLDAYKITMANEGGYTNDSTDAGGETFKGIARRYNPNWKGWGTIDMYKSNNNFSFPDCLIADRALDRWVEEFYKERYWDVNLLDEFNSQNVANEMFDTGVNIGVGRAAKFLQKALNLLNKDGLLYPDVVEDGKIGPNTIKALNKCVSHKGDSFLYKILNILQGQHYIEYMTKSPVQEKYAYGWLSRVDFLKK